MILKLKKVTSQTINIILIVSLLFLGSVFISSKMSGVPPEIFGHQLKVVLSGSMEPAFQTGSIIAIKTKGDMMNYQEGDVITFVNYDQKVVTHRVLESIHQGGKIFYRTKGDNNLAPDGHLVAAENALGKWTGFTIPYAGYLFYFINSKIGLISLVIIPGLLLLLYSIISVWGAFSRTDEAEALLKNVEREEREIFFDSKL